MWDFFCMNIPLMTGPSPEVGTLQTCHGKRWQTIGTECTFYCILLNQMSLMEFIVRTDELVNFAQQVTQ